MIVIKFTSKAYQITDRALIWGGGEEKEKH